MSMDLFHEYERRRNTFGQRPAFSDHVPSDLPISIPALPQTHPIAQQWTERQVTTTDIDCSAPMAQHEVNTVQASTDSKGASHTDGAWPVEAKTNEVQDRTRLLRKLKNEDSYKQAVGSLSRSADVSVQQNNTIDLFEEYFTDDEYISYSYTPPSCKTVAVFRDPNEIKRSATKISWHPEGPNKLAVSYSIMQFQAAPPNMPVKSYIWDVNSPNTPDTEILPPSPLTSLVYNPRSPDHLVGGTYNGLIGFWDLRKGSSPVEMSSIDKSHRDPVYDVSWIQSRAFNECCSVSTDGQLLWWDIRKLGSGPTDSTNLSSANDVLYGGTSIEYRSDAGATRYLVGTEQGVTLLFDRKAKKETDSQKAVKMTYGLRHGRHHGPVYSVQRNPFHTKYFLTVGDWSARVWMEDQKAPIMLTRYDRSYLTSACWSPTRAGVFFTTKMDGTMDAWDFYHKQTDPIFSTKLTDASLCTIKLQQQGRLCAVGSTDGSTTVVELSDALVEPQKEEKFVMAQIFEREKEREKNLEVRSTQRKAKRREKKGGSARPSASPSSAAAAGGATSPTGDEGTDGKDQKAMLEEIQNQFFSLVEVNAAAALKEEKEALEKERKKEPESKDAAEEEEEDISDLPATSRNAAAKKDGKGSISVSTPKREPGNGSAGPQRKRAF